MEQTYQPVIKRSIVLYMILNIVCILKLDLCLRLSLGSYLACINYKPQENEGNEDVEQTSLTIQYLTDTQ